MLGEIGNEQRAGCGSSSGTARRIASAALAWVGCMVAGLVGAASALAAVPVVSSLAPNNGGARGGTSVTISGSGFASGATVKFGEVAGRDVEVRSATSIVVVSPAGSGTVGVRVSDAGGASGVGAGDLFAFDPVLSGAWLGVDGNSEDAGDGGIGVFAAHDLLLDAEGANEFGAGVEVDAGKRRLMGRVLKLRLRLG